MEQELYEGLRKGRRWALEAVCRENLKRSWYLCCQLAGEPAGGAPLLLSAWKEALAAVKGMETLPSQDFAAILSEKIAALYQRGVAPKLQYEALPQPRLAASYQALATEVEKLPSNLRPYQSVSSGVASDITLDDLAEGDMVAVTTDEDGVQTIIVLEVETAGDSSSSISSTDSTSTEESALEEAAGETDASAE